MPTDELQTQWTARDIPDQHGRTFIVTGANSGLGEKAARALGAAGADVLLACRNMDKGAQVAREIGSNAEVRKLDLADLASVREFAESIDTVDVLVNNAGVMAVPLRRTADGFEMQFGTNHLGHFALTGLLLGKLTDRVVTMASAAHAIGTLHFEDPNWEQRGYRRWRAYGQSKLANLLFTYELQRRLTVAGSPLRAMAAHPGYSSTNLQSHTESFLDSVMSLGNRLIGQSADMGALPELYAATEPSVIGGSYIGPDGRFEAHGYPKLVGSTKKSKDLADARRLWELSEKFTGVTYSFES